MDIELVGRALTTLPEDDDHPYRSGPWRPQAEEFRADDLEVIGDLPTDLDGVYLRNTENPVHPAIQRYHPFDGDDMVHAKSIGICLDDSRTPRRFRTRGEIAPVRGQCVQIDGQTAAGQSRISAG